VLISQIKEKSRSQKSDANRSDRNNSEHDMQNRPQTSTVTHSGYDDYQTAPHTDRPVIRDNRTSGTRSTRERESTQIFAEHKQDNGGGDKLKFQPPAHYPATYSGSKAQVFFFIILFIY
jgi:hypothetical protein